MSVMTAAAPPHIEQIFKQVEEESERRALAEQQAESALRSGIWDPSSSPPSRPESQGRRRGGSISVSRFGQSIDLTSLGDSASTSGTINSKTAKRISLLASQSNFYQSQVNAGSKDSFASQGTESTHAEDSEHVTAVQTFGRRGTISKTVGEMLSRTMSGTRSRSNSRSMISTSPTPDTAVVIGVSVHQATVEAGDVDEEGFTTGTVSALNSKRSSMNSVGGGGGPDGGWVTKVTKALRRKSRSPPVEDGQPNSS